MLAALSLGIYTTLRSRKLMRQYWLRTCKGKEWKEYFPNTSNDDIRQFLDEFTAAFYFENKERLKFKPDDKIMDIYSALYPEGCFADSCEVENFANRIKQRYNVDLFKETNNAITLGEIFSKTIMQSQQWHRGDGD